jgi:[amino group carrier protein]-L-2-aminoadipate 6-kinase
VTTVVKLGGAVDPGQACADVASLARTGHRMVLVHGACADIGRLARRLRVPQRRLVAPDGVTSRYTDAPTLEVAVLALAGARKPSLISALVSEGVAAIGLTGLDAGLVRARRAGALRAMRDGRRVIVRDNHSGRVTAVKAPLLRQLLDLGLVPVLSPPALAEDGRPVNVNADRLAAAVAAALGADALVLVTNAPGVLADPGDPRTALPTYAVPATGPPDAFVGEGMALKLIAAREALRGGVRDVRVTAGTVEHPVRGALAGAGTRITVDELRAVSA